MLLGKFEYIPLVGSLWLVKDQILPDFYDFAYFPVFPRGLESAYNQLTSTGIPKCWYNRCIVVLVSFYSLENPMSPCFGRLWLLKMEILAIFVDLSLLRDLGRRFGETFVFVSEMVARIILTIE